MIDIITYVVLLLFCPRLEQVEFPTGTKVTVTEGILRNCESRRIINYDKKTNHYGVRGWCGKPRGLQDAFVKREYIEHGWVKKNGERIY